MRLCFLVEEHYRHDGMPLDVVRQLTAWGHRVDVLRPGNSLIHPGQEVRERHVPLGREVARIAAQVGEVFGLDLYGVDVLLGPDGPVVVDVNDFPSFRQVPDAVAKVSRAVLHLARPGAGSVGTLLAPTLTPAAGLA